MERRARLRDAKLLARQHSWAGQPRLERRVGGQNFLPVNASFFAQRAANHLDRALISQRNKPARHSRNRIIHISRSNRDSHRLRRLKEAQLNIKPSLGKVIALHSHKAARMRGKAQRTHHNLLVHRNRRRR